MAEDGGLHGIEAEANWRSRPRPPCSSSWGLARRLVREHGEFSVKQPELLAAAALETPSGQHSGLPGSQLPRRPAAGAGSAGELSAGETKAAGPRRGGGRTGAGRTRQELRQGGLLVHDLPPVKANQPTPLTRGIASLAEDVEDFLEATGLSADALRRGRDSTAHPGLQHKKH